MRLALRSKTTVITGGPGVGKTTIVKTILRILQAKAVTLRLCAPTGRAAKRMSEATGMEAKTIHRLLEVDPKTFGFRRPRAWACTAKRRRCTSVNRNRRGCTARKGRGFLPGDSR